MDGQMRFLYIDISVIVLAACFLGVSFILDDQSDEISSADIAVSAGLFCLFILPVGAMSWLAVTALSLYILLVTAANESRRRGAIRAPRRIALAADCGPPSGEG